MNYNIQKMASDYGLSEPYINKLNTTSDYIKNSFNQDRQSINTQYNQLINDYERERQTQNQKFTDEGKAAYIDYAKAINPYSANNASNARVGLNKSGFSESSLIGANNTYQNRYTDTKNNFENIFADINNRIGKAKENRSVEEAKIAKEEQDQLLQNFWRINESYQAEKAREEEQRRWEQEMALSRSRYYSEQSDTLDLSDNQDYNSNNNDGKVYNYLSSFIDRWSKSKHATFDKNDKNTMVKNVQEGLKRGTITEEQADKLLKKMGI